MILGLLSRLRDSRTGGSKADKPSPEGHGTDSRNESVRPLFVRWISGRSGSTLLMQLLATSEAIALDRSYPFEGRLLAYLLHHVDPIGVPAVPQASDVWWMHDASPIGWHHPPAAPLPFASALLDPVELHDGVISGVWEVFSRLISQGTGAKYYAEKFDGYAETLYRAGIEVRFLDLVRDPRDIWASILAFDERRGFYGFGRRASQARGSYLASFTGGIKRKVQVMARPVPNSLSLAVRYEDLISDLGHEATRISGWLGAPLDAQQVLSQRGAFEHHMTSDSPEHSVGRWTRDLPDEEIRFIETELGEEMESMGYILSRERAHAC